MPGQRCPLRRPALRPCNIHWPSGTFPRLVFVPHHLLAGLVLGCESERAGGLVEFAAVKSRMKAQRWEVRWEICLDVVVFRSG